MEQGGVQCATESGTQTSESDEDGSGEMTSELRPEVEESTCPEAKEAGVNRAPTLSEGSQWDHKSCNRLCH